MQYHLRTLPTTATVGNINGRKLSRRKKITPTHRALLAYELQTGALSVHHFTRKQALALTKASLGYATTVGRATAKERTKITRGVLSISNDRLVAPLGAERVLAAVDRITAPGREVVS